MRRMNRSRGTWIALTLTVGLTTSGCAALPKASVLFHHTPLLHKGTIPLKACLTPFQDARPPEEQKALRNIQALSDQVTAVVLRDFTDARLFESLQFNDATNADVILRGEIRSFTWRSNFNPLPFIPYAQIVSFFGVPAGKNVGKVAFALEVVDARTNQVIATYAKSSGEERDYSIYQASDYRAAGGEETGNAFRVTVDQLQAALLQDRERLVSAVRPGGAS